LVKKVNRDTSLTEAKQDAFLAAYGESGSKRAACLASNVGRSTVTDWEKNDTHGFKIKMAIATEMFREMLQDMAIGRVQNQKPNDNPVLLITLLNAMWPERYRRDGQTSGSEVKEMMVEWKRWVRDNKKKSKDDPKVSDAEKAHKNAIDQVESILTRKKSKNDDSG
jgi:hypothetical protein